LSETWRKRVGVEPTKDRLAALPGFEVRTSHRGRCSSGSGFIRHRRWVGRLAVGAAELVEALPVDAAQIPAAHGNATPIEEFKNLDRDLAAILETVAELCGGKLSVRCDGRKGGA